MIGENATNTIVSNAQAHNAFISLSVVVPNSINFINLIMKDCIKIELLQVGLINVFQ